ncbi:MAG: hypothetical protein Q4E64_06195 [Phascolarctobacterium sp.]|uniref:hypothetical protein n=1 Tax=Phascolarctobacterium sp. TaxID=2049039 RepID=UPI0026DD1EFD|nr:hypothetical protein [Phascolarctobacterium sp.]MDO4921396.1 hypothetical protein [Phascolarctobacterium sp.]
MVLSNLIGSLLLFQRTGIGENEIRIIAKNFNNILSVSLDKNITQIYRELNDFNDCFDFQDNKIVKTEYYYSNTQMLKKRFFDRLSDDDKNKIYTIVNML